MRYIWVVSCQVATYSGEVKVTSSEDLENATVEARAKAQVRREAGGSLPFGVCTFKVKSKRKE
jgi:hypothetical protein